METRNFHKDEKIYAFDGPWLYSARILNVSYDNDTRTKKYRIHYSGWSDDYDEEVKSDRILVINQETTNIKIKMDAQSKNTIHSCSDGIEIILKKEGKIKKFDKGARVIVYSEWLLHTGYVMDLEISKGIYKYCVRYMQNVIHYEDYAKSGEYKRSKRINDEWLTSDRLFEHTETCRDIQSKLLRYRKEEDEDILQDYFKSQQKVKGTFENEVELQNLNDTIVSTENSSNNSTAHLKGRIPKEGTFVKRVSFNSTRIGNSIEDVSIQD